MSFFKKKLRHAASRVTRQHNRNVLAVWCLSTGRVGSRTLAELAALHPDITALHEPWPHTFGISRLAYEFQRNRATQSELFLETIRAIREEPVGAAGIYLETSPQLTFLAPYLSQVFPQSRFVHLIRHPAAVVRSGMRRGWYDGHSHDRWRIRPDSDIHQNKEWEADLFEKNIWLWTETNRWIRQFLCSIDSHLYTVIRSEDLFSLEHDAIDRFFDLLGLAPPPEQNLKKVLTRHLNAQRSGRFPLYEDWTDEQRQKLHLHAQDLMRIYGYD